MSRCFTANSNHVWLLSCQRHQETDDDRKVYIITDLATAGPGPTLGWLISTHLFHTHTHSVCLDPNNTKHARTLPDLMRKDGKRGTKECRDKQERCERVDARRYWHQWMLRNSEREKVGAFASFRILAPPCTVTVPGPKVHSLQCAAATSALF